jgi:cyclophilin family peptidyl-prolyl cis-trans isomerase
MSGASACSKWRSTSISRPSPPCASRSGRARATTTASRSIAWRPTSSSRAAAPAPTSTPATRLHARRGRLVSHRRGTVGISTRGRDTGDAQIFVNLVDSPRLDHAVHGVRHGHVSGMDVVDRIPRRRRHRARRGGSGPDVRAFVTRMISSRLPGGPDPNASWRARLEPCGRARPLRPHRVESDPRRRCVPARVLNPLAIRRPDLRSAAARACPRRGRGGRRLRAPGLARRSPIASR